MTPADLRAIRESYKLSQADFAKMLRIDRSTWHNWETGRTEPPAIALTALAMLEHMRNRQYGLCLMDWLDQC